VKSYLRLVGISSVLLCAGVHGAEAWRLEVVRCPEGAPLDRPSLVKAIELELGPTAQAALRTVRVVWPCEDGATAKLSVEDRGARLESEVDLAPVQTQLRDRMVALVLRQLTITARALSELDPEPTAVAPTPVRVSSKAPRATRLGLRAAVTSRLFFSGPTPLVGIAVQWARQWFRAGVLVEGTRQELSAARIDGLVASATVGAMPFRWEQGQWEVAVGLFGEAGVAATSTTSKLAGYRGTSSAAPLAGGSVRTEVGWAPAAGWAVTLSLDVGLDVGHRVYIFDRAEMFLHGAFGQLRLGVDF
jgi:hypothetical protein